MASTAAETITQVQCTKQGGPFELVQVPKPTPGPGAVLVRQRVIALNLLDVKQRDYGILVPSWPRVLGVEGGGTVEAVGSDVRDFKVGDEIVGMEPAGMDAVSSGGAFQELTVVPEMFLSKKPKNLSFEEAASLPVGYATAIAAILNSLKTPLPFLPGTSTEGEAPSSVLVLGGSSVTGAAVIQLLRLAYPSLPILATSSTKHHARLTELGATHLVDYKSSNVVANLQAASPRGAGVDVIIDCVAAGASQTDISNVLDPSGSKRYAAVVTGTQIPVPEGVTLINAEGFSIFQLQGGKHIMASLAKLVDDGKYRLPLPVRVVGHGLNELPKVLDEVKTVSGEKVVVTLEA